MTSILSRRLIPALFAVLVFATGATWLTMRRPAATVPAVYAALGASDTVGVGADERRTEGWAPRVHAALPAGTQFLNLGVGGATLDDVLEQQLPPAVDAMPRWVTLWPGVNDLRSGVPRDRFAANLDTLLQQFLAPAPADGRLRPTVILINIPDLRHLPAFASVDPVALDATVQTWNALIADAASRHGAILVDLYGQKLELSEHPEYISADGFHPSSEGYRRIAELVVAALEQHAASPAP